METVPVNDSMIPSIFFLFSIMSILDTTMLVLLNTYKEEMFVVLHKHNINMFCFFNQNYEFFLPV